ncbi:hypothetical protein IFM89_036738, partial [Coptis chinensis]
AQPEESDTRKSKLINLTTMKAENRISSLEQSLVHHILSFMDMKQVVQTSLLSKRWRNVWHSLRILNFDEESWRSSRNDNKLNKGKFKFFVDTVLLLRDGSDIDTFNLFFSSAHFGDFDRIDRWVAYGMERSVQVVTLVGLHVPSPSSICLSANVSCLDLGAIIFPRDGNMELVLDLSVVENLNIQNCDHIKINKLIISGLKLKYLRLANDFQEFNCDTSVKLCAPNLVSLKCNGYAYEEYALEDLTSLVTAEIDTMIVCKDELKGAPEAQEVVNIWWYGRCLEQILKGITTAKSLTLSGHGFQVFKELPEMLEGDPISFPRLKYLKITEWLLGKDNIMQAGVREFKTESADAKLLAPEMAAPLVSLSQENSMILVGYNRNVSRALSEPDLSPSWTYESVCLLFIEFSSNFSCLRFLLDYKIFKSGGQ